MNKEKIAKALIDGGLSGEEVQEVLNKLNVEGEYQIVFVQTIDEIKKEGTINLCSILGIKETEGDNLNALIDSILLKKFDIICQNHQGPESELGYNRLDVLECAKEVCSVMSTAQMNLIVLKSLMDVLEKGLNDIYMSKHKSKAFKDILETLKKMADDINSKTNNEEY